MTVAKEPRVTGLVWAEVELPRVEMVEAVVVEAMPGAEMRSRSAMTIEVEVANSSPRPGRRAERQCEDCEGKNHHPTGHFPHHVLLASYPFLPAPHDGTSLPEISLVKTQAPPATPRIHLDGPGTKNRFAPIVKRKPLL